MSGYFLVTRSPRCFQAWTSAFEPLHITQMSFVLPPEADPSPVALPEFPPQPASASPATAAAATVRRTVPSLDTMIHSPLCGPRCCLCGRAKYRDGAKEWCEASGGPTPT